jgi:hypothetical protein
VRSNAQPADNKQPPGARPRASEHRASSNALLLQSGASENRPAATRLSTLAAKSAQRSACIRERNSASRSLPDECELGRLERPISERCSGRRGAVAVAAVGIRRYVNPAIRTSLVPAAISSRPAAVVSPNQALGPHFDATSISTFPPSAPDIAASRSVAGSAGRPAPMVAIVARRRATQLEGVGPASVVLRVRRVSAGDRTHGRALVRRRRLARSEDRHRSRPAWRARLANHSPPRDAQFPREGLRTPLVIAGGRGPGGRCRRTRRALDRLRPVYGAFMAALVGRGGIVIARVLDCGCD